MLKEFRICKQLLAEQATIKSTFADQVGSNAQLTCLDVIDNQVIAYRATNVGPAHIVVHDFVPLERTAETNEESNLVTELVHPDRRATASPSIAVELVGPFFDPL